MCPTPFRTNAAFFYIFVFISTLSAQRPVISKAGIVNAASWASPSAPGGIVAIFGTNLAAAQQSANDTPLPTQLGGTSVTIGGIDAPLFFVSPGQINAQVPASIPVSPSPLSNSQLTVDSAQVVVKTAAGSSAGIPVALTHGSPAFFSADQSGCGQAAALNIRRDGSISINSPSNSAAPGDFVSLYGTGFGVASQQPPDGAPVSSAVSLQAPPRVFLDGAPLPSLSYAGLAPSLVGVDQINFQVPATARNGCSVPVSALGVFGGPPVTISVHSGGGQCSDPPPHSWGQLLFNKTTVSEPGPLIPPPFEVFTASFPSGPTIQAPGHESVVLAPDYAAPQTITAVIAILTTFPVNFRACAIPGVTELSAGTIQITPPAGAASTIPPLPIASGGVSYVQSLPSGFIGPGTYSIAGTPGSDVGLNTSLTIGSPIQLAPAFAPGTAISNTQPLSIQWTGGDANSLVRLSITALPTVGPGAAGIYSYAPASAGSLTVKPKCGTDGACSFGLASAAGGVQVQVQVVPDPARLTSITVPGITGPVQASWSYTWNFAGISLAP
jgi:uncharacterized protein (TIGR03437 family)